MFLSDSSDDEQSNQKARKNQDTPEIEDRLFLLLEKELEVIDHLLLFEIKVFAKHMTKIKGGRSFSSYFNPEDHMVNARFWIKKSIGFFRDQRIREADDLELNNVDNLEDYMIHCIKCHDEEVKSLSKSQSKHTDQSVPEQSASNNVTKKDFMQEELDKNDIENTENFVLNEQQVPKHNDGQSTSHTEETLSSVDGMNQDKSPEKRQKVSDEASNDSNTESDVAIITDIKKKGSGKNELYVNKEENRHEPHVPITDDSQN